MDTAEESLNPSGKTGGLQANKECDLCGGTTPVKFCQECEFTLCPICATGHQKIKATQDHPLVDIDIVSGCASYAKSGDCESRTSSCVKHPKNAIEFYCEECIVMLCTDCCQDHKDHSVKPLDLKTYQNICTHQIKSLLDRTHELEEYKTLIAGIFSNYDEAIQMVTKWEEELVQLVQESSRSLRADLENAKGKWKGVVDDNEKGITKIATDVENKLTVLNSIRKVTDVDIFSNELAASQQLLEKVKNFIENVLPTLKVPSIDDLLPNMSQLATAKTKITNVMSNSKATKTVDESSGSTEKSTTEKSYPLPNLGSLEEKYKIDIEDPDSYTGYRINKSYSNEKGLMIHGSCRKDVRFLNLEHERYTSKCKLDYVTSSELDIYVGTRSTKVYLLNRNFKIIDSLTSDKMYKGVLLISDHTVLLLGTGEDKTLAHLSLVKIQDGRLAVIKESSLNVKEEMRSFAIDGKKTQVFIGGNKHLYKVALADWAIQHFELSQWLKDHSLWCLYGVGDHILAGDSGGQVHMLDTQLIYKKIILEIPKAVRDIAVASGYLVVTSQGNKVYLYK